MNVPEKQKQIILMAIGGVLVFIGMFMLMLPPLVVLVWRAICAAWGTAYPNLPDGVIEARLFLFIFGIVVATLGSLLCMEGFLIGSKK